MVPIRWLGAFSKGHRASAREFIDDEFSYGLLDKALNGDEKAASALDYLSKFNNEYHKNVIRKDDPNALHHTDTLRRDLYARENAKNRDIMSVRKTQRIYWEQD